ncbi:TPA: hypothetical protein CPT80_03340 [Candidatus Gastranaerophilales bacterium HUM_9]|nr:MAG TPA: hypothetical protein CPT80_03340 [Candidatus Gastranaerophilales bacterium HUM_9]HBX34902.1 hypothetical protein [Cyanobacteria bacterium UBA11440]
MGKSKKRILAKGAHSQISKLSRKEAIEIVLNSTSKDEIENIISLFGLKPEELLEAGMNYESVKLYEGLF